jgi:TolA-binding protein
MRFHAWGPARAGETFATARPRAVLLLATLVCALLAVAAGAPAAAQADDADDTSAAAAAEHAEGPLEAQKASVAVAALEERNRTIAELLADAARAYRRVALERGPAQQELTSSLERLDREAVRAKDLTRERLDQLAGDVDRARSRLQQLNEEGNRRLEDIRRLLGERDSTTRRIADLRGRTPAVSQPLTGTWEVTWMPNGVTGTFYLDQSGTLVTGQYKLGALGSGSLQGTFVGGKVFLQRIDAQRGRDSEIEGVLEADGARIRGTWQNYEMVQGGIPRGQWVARRVR